ncbi:ACP S-malonyltransferase [Labedaea rhizosphaerae]|uniref:[acyl-carrier-protein] S-malonyltransferase n=1 Tax=Labedaea rhizosphaerae TaxID=598644 RepID=A0A4R6SML4_LABRH|nr:ACP S-malonyltransferase [Labedaea rhizosphaerae]TDQ04413.1 [acyl-carrier-protein] S-malonyltransferase [Labedaea rhizosphaerae]
MPDPSAGSALVFPGMSPSRFEDAAKFMLINPVARTLIKRVDEALGYSLVARYRETEGDYSEYAQVAFLVNCLALADWAAERFDPVPQVIVGPSFGGKAAAVRCGALGFEDAVVMTARWARKLEEYFAEHHKDVVTHSFTRTPRAELDKILAELDEQGEWYEIANHVDADFWMLSVRRTVLDWLNQRLRASGGMPLYTMHPPMHCSAFTDLRSEVDSEILAGLTWSDPHTPVIADQDGTVRDTADGVRTMLLDGFTCPVRWPEVVAALRGRGVGKIYLSGLDSLFGRVPITTSNFEVVSFNPRTAVMPRRKPAARSVA